MDRGARAPAWPLPGTRQARTKAASGPRHLAAAASAVQAQVNPSRSFVIPAKAGIQGFQPFAPLFKPGAGSGSPLARGLRGDDEFLVAEIS